MTILEIALWKMKINDNSVNENTTQQQKKIKVGESDIRQLPVSPVGLMLSSDMCFRILSLWRTTNKIEINKT